MNKNRAKALKDIQDYGCHILHVFEHDGCPRFTYCIGIEKTSGQPELMVTGLKQEVAHFVINEYNRRVRAGEVFKPGKFYGGFLGGFDVTFREVEKKHYATYFGWGIWLYGGQSFQVLQLIYPSTSGVWPWDENAPDGYTWGISQLYKN